MRQTSRSLLQSGLSHASEGPVLLSRTYPLIYEDLGLVGKLLYSIAGSGLSGAGQRVRSWVLRLNRIGLGSWNGKATIVRYHATISIPKDWIATLGAGARLSSRSYGRGSCDRGPALSSFFLCLPLVIDPIFSFLLRLNIRQIDIPPGER